MKKKTIGKEKKETSKKKRKKKKSKLIFREKLEQIDLGGSCCLHYLYFILFYFIKFVLFN